MPSVAREAHEEVRVGEILAVTSVLNRTYTVRITAHSHAYRVLNQVSPVGGLRGALHESTVARR
jgi:hypothetical protein